MASLLCISLWVGGCDLERCLYASYIMHFLKTFPTIHRSCSLPRCLPILAVEKDIFQKGLFLNQFQSFLFFSFSAHWSMIGFSYTTYPEKSHWIFYALWKTKEFILCKGKKWQCRIKKPWSVYLSWSIALCNLGP